MQKITILDSSVVEQSAVNRLVVGSSPTWGVVTKKQYMENNSDKLIIELNDKFHKSSEIKKNLAENKISQMKEAAIKEIKDASIKIAVDSVKKIITTSVDKSKLDAVFQKNLDETKEELKKINS